MVRKSNRIKETAIGGRKSNINETKTGGDQKVSFDFRYLREQGGKFCYQNCNQGYLRCFVERLRDLCRMTRIEMQTNRSNSLRCHQINFDETTENGFGLNIPDIDDDAWQFQISSNMHGRIHGFFVGDIFHVVWLDVSHELFT